MNLQELLMNAYKNGAKTASTGGVEPRRQGASPAVSAPVFPKITRQPAPAADAPERKPPEPQKRDAPAQAFVPRAFPAGAASAGAAGGGGNPSADVAAAARALTAGGLLKVPALPRDADGRESVYRRVAKFLLLIGVDEAAKILPRLSDEQTEKIIPEIASIQRVEPDEAEAILEEFQSLFSRAREDGGVETARAMLEKAFGSDRAKEILENASANVPLRPFEYLSEADSEKVSLLLRDESAAVRALVLSYLKPKVSAEVIRSLAPMEKKEVILRLAGLSKISPDVLRRVDAAMHEKVKRVNVQRSDMIDGRDALAQILRRMDPSSEEEILGTLAETDAELGADLRDRLFTTEDIVRADDRYIQDYLRKMDDNDVAFLIAGKGEEFRAKILGNVSQSRAKEIQKTEEVLRPMKRSEVEKMTGKFIADMRSAYDSGDLVVAGREGGEYV